VGAESGRSIGFVRAEREGRIVLGGALLYLVVSFFEWQHFTVVIAIRVDYGFTEWNGIGVIACVSAIALIVWELARFAGVRLRSDTAGFVSVALGVLLFLFTVLTFVVQSEGRQWPAWVGLALSAVIGGTAVLRARAEGVQMLRSHPVASPGSAAQAEPRTRPDEERQSEGTR
jgi:hypothetical protein